MMTTTPINNVQGHFAQHTPSPEAHFRLHFYAAVNWLLEGLTRTTGLEAAVQEFPFLKGYLDELHSYGRVGEVAWWDEAIATWEQQVQGHLPLRALQQASGLGSRAITLWMVVGLLEEDPRFGLIFEVLHNTPGQQRPSFGLLEAWGRSQGEEVRSTLLSLLGQGWLVVSNSDAPRLAWTLQVSNILWDAVQGQLPQQTAGFLFEHLESSPRLEQLILPGSLKQTLDRLLPMLESVQTLVVRGPRHSGRRTLVSALARGLGQGVLELHTFKADDLRWKIFGSLATALNAFPVLVQHLAPGENLELPPLNSYVGPKAVVLGKQGGLAGVGQAVTINLNLPTVAERQQHWAESLQEAKGSDLPAIAERYRLSAGQIRRTAEVARTYAMLEQRKEVTLEDVRYACRTLGRQALETLATPLTTTGEWNTLAVAEETRRDLTMLEGRIRYREQLSSAVGKAMTHTLNVGVRALFTGPSGTGKTLAARLLAQRLGLDVYRLDLSRVVNKYIGETEKNLEQTLSLAEELGILLLLDEGDALLTQRTGVQSANDRYANLETNYLLQRLESFEGLLIVTTNAAERIDSAFQRRMDTVIEFRLPEASERLAIWEVHLPPQHEVSAELLHEMTRRCTLSGGQIRNAALHATLLALENGGVVTSAYLELAVRREYRKLGQVCPLRGGHDGTSANSN